MMGLIQSGHVVDVLLKGAPPGTERLLQLSWGKGKIGRVYRDRAPLETYDWVLPNWMYRGTAASKHGERVAGLAPIPANVSESYAHIKPALDLGLCKDPVTTCCYYEVPKSIEPVGYPTVALHMGSKQGHWVRKRYSRYQEVMDELWKKDPSIHFRVICGPLDDDSRGLSRERVELFHDLPIHLIAGVIEASDVFLGNDAGPAHVAAAVGTPTVIVYGPTDITKNLPPMGATWVSLELPCQPCQRRKWGVLSDGTPCKTECMDMPPSLIADMVWRELVR